MLLINIKIAHREWNVTEAEEEISVDVNDERFHWGEKNDIADIKLNFSTSIRTIEQNWVLDVSEGERIN